MSRLRSCGKRAHATYAEAQRVIRLVTEAQRLKGKNIRSQDIYRCERCHQFHTTSHSYRQQKETD